MTLSLLLVLFQFPSLLRCTELTLSTGQIRGHLKYSQDGRPYAAYDGIPYANPPTRDLRWQPPVPVSPWEGVRDCTTPPPICPQFDYDTFELTGQEDCLYLNVETPVVGSQLLHRRAGSTGFYFWCCSN